MEFAQPLRTQLSRLLLQVSRKTSFKVWVEGTRWLCAAALLFFHLSWGWAVGLTAGLFAILAGVAQLWTLRNSGTAGQTTPVDLPLQKGPAQPTPNLFARVPPLIQVRMKPNLDAGKAKLAGAEPAPGAENQPDEEEGTPGAGNPVRKDRPIPGLPYPLENVPVTWIPALSAVGGGFVLVGALLSLVLPDFLAGLVSARVSLYAAAPMLFLWGVSEMLVFAPPWMTRPHGDTENLGMMKSGLQVISACLLWVCLGLKEAAPVLGVVAWGALACGAVGVYLGVLVESSSSSA